MSAAIRKICRRRPTAVSPSSSIRGWKVTRRRSSAPLGINIDDLDIAVDDFAFKPEYLSGASERGGNRCRRRCLPIC
ncbi:hypothetical protein M8494_27455 [Serratia ureilytica]